MQNLPMKALVFSSDGNTSRWYGRAQLQAMLGKGLIQARRDGRTFAWLRYGEIACRTFVARKGPLAAMGRSQVYTIAGARRAVVGLKTIFPEDKGFFLPGNNL